MVGDMGISMDDEIGDIGAGKKDSWSSDCADCDARVSGWTYLTETPGILSVLKDLVDDGNRKFFFLVSEEIFGPAWWARQAELG